MYMSAVLITLMSSSSVYDNINVPVPEWAVQSYESDVLFTVKRKGKKIGTHTVKFRYENDDFIVDTETKLKVKFLFFTAYKFDYKAREIWREGRLSQVITSTKDGGDTVSYEMAFEQDKVIVDNGEAQEFFKAETSIYPTNHWHPKVLGTAAVMNTISGNKNAVEITAHDWEVVPAGDETRKAQRFTYEGELNNVAAWYDERGRWVGLEFKGKDGSIITYECVRCGV